ncbi:MAG TPA: hypothetical protein VL137_05265 [Polyangiaceae bacterium]|nr:hypothetical protein [Polyangiaceae bacterium]
MRVARTLLLLGILNVNAVCLASSARAALTTEASALGPATITLDSQTGLRWLDVTLATPYSYDALRAELGAVGIFAGYRLATYDEVLQFWQDAGINTDSLGAFTTQNFTPISNLMGFVGITGLGTGNRDNVHFFDYTAGHIESGVGLGNWVEVATIAADPYTFFDGRPDFGAVPSDNDNDEHGAWLVVSRPPASIVSVDTSFGTDTGTLDTNTGLLWLDVTLSTPYSYDQLQPELAPGGVFEGYRMATMEEVLTLWSDAGIDTAALNEFVPQNFQPIVDLMLYVGVTGAATGNRDGVHFFDFTEGHTAEVENGWVNVLGLAADPYAFLDGRADLASVPTNNVNPEHGSWLVAVPPATVQSVLLELSGEIADLHQDALTRQLEAKVQQVLKHWEAGQVAAAKAQLSTLIQQLRGPQGRRLPASVAAELIALAEQAIQLMGT